jgi:hypothetical protein
LTCYINSEFAFDACCCCFNIRPAMVNKKHSELVKKQTRDRYGKFASPSSRTAPPPSRQEVGSSSHHRTTLPPSHMQEIGSSSHCRTAPPPPRQEALSDDSVVEMWVVASPPPTHLQEASSKDSPSDSSGYNDECPHAKEVSSYKLLLDYNCLV